MNGRNRIIVCGEEFEVGGDIEIITFRDPKGLSFEDARRKYSSITDSEYLYPRRSKGNVVTKIDELKELVQMVVLHSDITWTSRECFDVLCRRGFSTHFMIDWDGKIYQSADLRDATLHAGEVNNFSIGIDLNNRLPNILMEDVRYPPPDYPEMEEEKFKRPLSEVMMINGGRYQSYGYTDPQYNSLIGLLKTLIKIFSLIKPQCPFGENGEIITNVLENTAFAGFVAHWHISPTRWDPGPGFDWQRVFHGLSREHNSLPILSLVEGNIGELLSPEKVEKEVEKIYINNEKSSGGGYFPIGINQNWHGGIHLHLQKGEKVFSMFDGVLAAAHFGDYSEIGSSNFVLLRHDINLPKDRVFKFYSLYMHLGHISLENNEDAPQWLKQSYRIFKGEEEKDELSALQPSKIEKPEKKIEGEFEKMEEKEEMFLLDVGDALPALKKGMIALFPLKGEERIEVKAGEFLGFVGEFLDEGLLHLETWTDATWKDAIDIGVHGEFFKEIEEDMGDDLIIESEEILNIFYIPSWKKKIAGGLTRKKIIDPTDVENLYNSPYSEDVEIVKWLRKCVTRHVNEWSDRVNWFKTLSKSQEWSEKIKDIDEWIKTYGGVFREEIKKFLPFIWLNETVAKHIGLERQPWDGILYHFHPINLLMWLTYHSSQRIQVLSIGKTMKELKKEIEKEKKRYEEWRKEKRFDINSENFHEEIYIAEEIEEKGAGAIFDDIYDIKIEGEWE